MQVSPGIVIIHVLISNIDITALLIIYSSTYTNYTSDIYSTCDLNFILFSPPKLMAHILLQKIFLS